LLLHKLVKFDPEITTNPFARINIDPGYEQTRAGGTSIMGGLPLMKPVYGTLTGVDMNTGEILWKVPMGKGSGAIRNNPALNDVKVPERLGCAGPAGSIVTKGGLIFVGGGERALYAFDKDTRKEVWSTPLQRPVGATPKTYRTKSGRKFVIAGTCSAGSDGLGVD